MRRIITWLSMFCLLVALPLSAGTAFADTVASAVSHTVQRSDGTKASADEKHEFNGGSHEFFNTLKEHNAVFGWLERTSDSQTFQQGWTRMYLDWPVRISSIVIYKVSVGKNDFKGGEIELEVQTTKGKWIKVFEQKDADIEQAVTIKDPLKSTGPVKGVRLQFRTPSPITVGPIDLHL